MHKNKIQGNLRLGCLVSIVRVAGLTGGDRAVINKLEHVFTVTSNDGDLFAVLLERVELVGEGRL